MLRNRRVTVLTDDIPWWLAGGIPQSNCIAAYQPVGASGLTESYTNLANPGTYNAAPGTAPTWDVTNGWKFDGISHQYLKTNIIPATGYSIIIKFSGVVTPGTTAGIIGCQSSATNKRFIIIPSFSSGAYVRYGYDGGISVIPELTAGVLGIVPGAGYRNGIIDTFALGTVITSMPKILIGNYSYDVAGGETPWTGWLVSNIQSFAIYSSTLTSSQVAALTTAMNKL